MAREEAGARRRWTGIDNYRLDADDDSVDAWGRLFREESDTPDKIFGLNGVPQESANNRSAGTAFISL